MATNTSATDVHEGAGLNTAPLGSTPDKSKDNHDKEKTFDDSDDEDRKAHVARYTQEAAFPLEIGETVWIVKPGYRAPLGEFRITKAHPNDMFELQSCATNAAHTELVAGKDLRRNV
ncbi:uncharacterized protein FIESC28_01089 [Fusarium coffeatum]|uniref:Uncharacterized protein n=1 Tax=Fusarium coffeatum TaxID=231269 RepID=A0A366S9S3_9HYPO|nr:uncharacterized protein FIESC28_01089 [Fusarium coffeatum]RBR26061.1 hypothetical protein FIESC28_01089 [Fusarium coffeatum]